MTRLLLMTATLVALTACSSPSSPVLDALPDGQITSADAVRSWLLWVIPGRVRSQVAFANTRPSDDRMGMFLDETCPTVSVEGNTVTVTGGCTDSSGRSWHGRSIQRDDDPQSTTGSIRYEDFGFETTLDCGNRVVPHYLQLDGTVTISGDLSRQEFDIDLAYESANFHIPIHDRLPQMWCSAQVTKLAWDYSGVLDNSDENVTVQSGSGRIGLGHAGVVYTETKDLRVRRAGCELEPDSGTTLLRSGSDTVVVTFDGDADCDQPATAHWTLNGDAQEELTELEW